MTEASSVVLVVDDDPSVRRAIKRLVESVGLQVELFGSAQEFLRRERPNAPSCLVLDIRLPGISGLDLQRELAETNIHIPIIFITAHADIPMTVRAMKAGAVEFLTTISRSGSNWMLSISHWSGTVPIGSVRQKSPCCGTAWNR
jgi:FixJ family two-component response regulator